jgi:hypothetical protein
MTNLAFERPVLLTLPENGCVTSTGEALEIARAMLHQQFTFGRLSMVLMLERVTGSHEVEEARHAFRSWATSERLLQSAA